MVYNLSLSILQMTVEGPQIVQGINTGVVDVNMPELEQENPTCGPGRSRA